MSSVSEHTRVSRTLAALDLGSNSFHMVIGEQDSDGGIQFIDRVKEMVRLNAGLDADGNLTEESQQRALECLSRFSQRLRHIPASQVRAVGTNTFRAAHNGETFIRRAESVLGHHISVISGHEEARLVYLGAAFSLASSGLQRLVIDIGGGSTELIIGRGYEAVTMSSLYMGCVSWSRAFFPDGKITAKRVQSAKAAAFRELEPVVQQYVGLGWQEVVGTSGTIRAVDDLARNLGSNQDWLSAKGIALVESWLVEKANSSNLDLVSEQRRAVFAGGFCIIAAIFDALHIARLDAASGALREGVLFDLNGRFRDHDSRDQGVTAMAKRFDVDREQAARIKSTCEVLLDRVGVHWNLTEIIHHKLLGWASELHEIGIAIAFAQNHKHGAYITENFDIDGFSRQQQRLLALLIRSHRQKFPIELYDELPQTIRNTMIRLSVLLRISFALNRGRMAMTFPPLQLVPGNQSLKIQIAAHWANEHPLTMLDLELESEFLSKAGFELNIQPVEA